MLMDPSSYHHADMERVDLMKTTAIKAWEAFSFIYTNIFFGVAFGIERSIEIENLLTPVKYPKQYH
jgi:hypothetical protein